MSVVRTIRYEDGGWCEQEQRDGVLHGRWTVFDRNGRKTWERRYVEGLQEGYERRWDVAGRLIEERFFHLGALHGPWRRWNDGGEEQIVGLFMFGYREDALDEAVNPEFARMLRPHLDLEPEQIADRLAEILAEVRRESFVMMKVELDRCELSRRGSFWSYVNVLGAGEEWPHHRGAPLAPILQIDCSDAALRGHSLGELSYVTVFAASGDVLRALGEDIVVRAYAAGAPVVQVEPPHALLDAPARLAPLRVVSYPDRNDLPPGLVVFLERTGLGEEILEQPTALRSRLGGWPGWLQSTRIADFDTFAFQVDSLDVAGWSCGDSTMHYFFRSGETGELSWHQDSC